MENRPLSYDDLLDYLRSAAALLRAIADGRTQANSLEVTQSIIALEKLVDEDISAL